MGKYIRPTEVIDHDNPEIIKQANKIANASKCVDDVSKAVSLYYFVRDTIRYDPYVHFHKAKYYKASKILKVKRGNCICKSVLLCALARTLGISARLGFANVRNHLATKRLIKFIGSKTFLFHGYTELFLNKKWVIATPAFNLDLCLLHNVTPLDFDGHNNSIFQLYNSKNKIYMEYIKYHGTFSDLPLDKILSAWKKGYGEKRVMGWINDIETNNLSFDQDFYEERIY